ncbi:MAG: hypothetical protein ACRCZF_24930 [Gemmataceae bacterium]
MFRWILWLVLIASFGTAAVLGYNEWARPTTPGLVIESDTVQFDTAPETARDIVYKVTNTGRHPVQVVGYFTCCGRQCGVKLHDEAPFTIAPGTTHELKCTVQVGTGRFAQQIHLFVDDLGLREHTLHVLGHAWSNTKPPGETPP